MMKIDAKWALLGERLDYANIAGRDRRCICFTKSFRERIAVAVEQLTHFVRCTDQRQRLAQTVGPRANNGRNLTFKGRNVDRRCCATGAANNEMHADQRPLVREEWIERRYASDKRARQIRTDLGADLTVISLARHKHEHRHKAVKAIVPCQDTHAWPLIKLQNGYRKSIERVFVDLEQFVAWIMLQHIRQCFAGMAAGAQAGALLYRGDLAAEIRNAMSRTRIGRGGEQPDDAMLADEIAGRIESLHPDIIEIDP